MTINPIPITTAGYGTMNLTWKANPEPLEKSIQLLTYLYQQYGIKLFNCGEFYQNDEEYSNLKLMNEFLKTLPPDEVGDIIVAIKGGLLPGLIPDGSKENIDKSIEHSISYFKHLPTKPFFIFEIARVDPNVPFDTTIGYIYDHVKSGNIDGISLSEVSAKSIALAASVAPISFIEVEFSLFTPDIIYNGILQEASKHNIPISAYSPLCKGLLTDYAVTHDDFIKSLDASDFRSHFDKFSPENFEKNKATLLKFHDIAKSYNVKLEVLALSYFDKLSNLEIFENIANISKIIPIPSASSISRIDDNYGKRIDISNEDLAKIQDILKNNPIQGLRYNAVIEKVGHLNG